MTTQMTGQQFVYAEHPDAIAKRVEEISEEVFDAMESLGIEDATMTDARMIAENVLTHLDAHPTQQALDAAAERDEWCVCPGFGPVCPDDTHTQQCSDQWRRLVDRLVVGRAKTLTDTTLADLAKPSYAEGVALRRAYDRDVWAQEWNSLPTAIDRVVADHNEKAATRLAALLDEVRTDRNSLAERLGSLHTYLDHASDEARADGVPLMAAAYEDAASKVLSLTRAVIPDLDHTDHTDQADPTQTATEKDPS